MVTIIDVTQKWVSVLGMMICESKYIERAYESIVMWLALDGNNSTPIIFKYYAL
jgi:hypothetical protein